jgi:hypothetical protein
MARAVAADRPVARAVQSDDQAVADESHRHVRVRGRDVRDPDVLGETSPEPKLSETDRLQDLADHCYVEDIHATILHALGIDFTQEIMTPVGRPMALSKGKVLTQLLA